jgi:hypothetical protein
VLKPAIMFIVLATGLWPVGAPGEDRSAVRAWSFSDVYAAAVLAGRDPDAAVRKARYRTDTMVRDLGMTQAQATREVSRWMVRNAGGLCTGG